MSNKIYNNLYKHFIELKNLTSNIKVSLVFQNYEYDDIFDVIKLWQFPKNLNEC